MQNTTKPRLTRQLFEQRSKNLKQNYKDILMNAKYKTTTVILQIATVTPIIVLSTNSYISYSERQSGNLS